MQMRAAASSLHELMGAGLLRRMVGSCVLEVQYEEHTPEPYNPLLKAGAGLSGGARSTPPPPPRRRFDTPADPSPALPGNGNTQPIWPPPATELARLTALAEQYAPPAQASLQFAHGTMRFGVPAQAPEYALQPWAAAAAAQHPTLLTAADASAEPAPRLELLPPRAPDFTLGPPLLPERAHDPHYYPGISDEPPAPEAARPRWHRWAAFAAAGLVLFGAGMIVRSLSGAGVAGAVIDVTPLDAQVKIDGELIPPTSSPRVREGLIHGEHTLEIERRGFLGVRRVFKLAEGEGDQRIVITLLPEPVAPPPAAAVIPPPQAAAPAPVAAEPPRPAPAPAADDSSAKSSKQPSSRELQKQRRAERVAERYRARKAAAAEAKASKADATASKAEARAARAEKAAQAKADKAEAKAARGSAKADAGAPTAMLKLNSTPWSEVYVDDRHVGHTPVLGLPLTAGKHTIRLINPQLGGKKTIKVRLKAGQTLVKIVTL
jgi:hypothetical protein